MGQIKDYPEQTTPVATDQILIQDVSNVNKKITPPNLRKEMVKSGYFDLIPVHTDFTGASAPARGVVTGSRTARRFNGSSGGAEEIQMEYHIPHDILMTMTQYEIHLHLEHAVVSPTGSARFNLAYSVGLADGTFTAEITKTIDFTPVAGDIFKQRIIKLENITDSVALFQPDTMISLRLWRLQSDVADTFADYVFYHGCDFHLQGDQKLTTSKDLGAGWVKS